MANYKVEALKSVEKTLLGEGPHWDAERQTLYFVDIMGCSVGSYHPATGKSARVTIDGECLGERSVSLVVPIAKRDDEFLISHGRSLKKLHWDSASQGKSTVTSIYDCSDENNLDGRFNDGKCDNAGRLWAGTMGVYKHAPSPEDLTKGNILKISGDGSVSKEFSGVGVSNGLAWSRDDKTLYYIDSYPKRVDAFDYNASTGKISNRRPVFDFERQKESGLPDGMTIDENGNLWVACFGGSKVIQIDPVTGEVIRRVELPTKHITSVAFGGKNLDELYVTCSKFYLSADELAAEPEAGSVFKVTNLNVRGLSAGVPYTAA